MTKAEFAYWGTPVVATTLTDDLGKFPIGYINHLGVVEVWDPATVSRVGTTVTTPRGDYEIVWDGAKPARPGDRWDYTKGRLLPVEGPPYVDSLKALAGLVRVHDYGKDA